jgi:photosystem II stability/assembly factor-like uncharacterized protein
MTLDGIAGDAVGDVVAVGFMGTVIHTNNNGAQWSTVGANLTTDLLAFVWLSAGGNGFVVGENGTILHSTDGGTTWISEASGTTSTLTGVFGFGETDVYAVGANGTILHRQ